jgi:plastocyanin
MFKSASIFALGLAVLPYVSAAVHDIQVGAGGMKFDPEAIFADPGDQVVFHFVAKNHTVTQSSLANPCGRKDGGFDSGFQPVAANQTDNFPTWTLEVKDTQPIWAYCAQAADQAASHCGAGMVFSVNCGPDDAPNSFKNFKDSALAIGTKLKEAAASSSSPDTSGGYGGYGGSPSNTASGSASTPATSGSSTGNVHKVVVGGAGGKLTFDPPQLSAQQGDTVTFEFQQKNHSLVQSTFDAPCSPKDGGFKTEFFPVADGETNFPTWSLTVNDTNPVWLYCRQKTPNHCGLGMVFAINSVETSDKSLSAFQQAAKATANSSTTGGASTGGNNSTTSGTSTGGNSGASTGGNSGASTAGNNGAVSVRGVSMGVALVIPALIASLL